MTGPRTSGEQAWPGELSWHGKALDELLRVTRDGSNLARAGCILMWLHVHAEYAHLTGEKVSQVAWLLSMGSAGRSAVHRRPKREAFPIRLGELVTVKDALANAPYELVLDEGFVSQWATDCWTYLSVVSCNWLHGCRGVPAGRWRKVEVTAVSTLRATVERTLQQDFWLSRTVAAVEKELSARFVSYSGEEVPKMEVLSFERGRAALPPEGHGGSIPVLEWTKGRTRTFLMHPEECVAEDVGQTLPKLQAKVHIETADRLRFAELLVSRGVCAWVNYENVFTYRGEKVLNGMFAVAKSTVLESGETAQRVIMNLIPSNACLLQLEGRVQGLPGVTQYLSMTLDGNKFSDYINLTWFQRSICLDCHPSGGGFFVST